VLAAAGTGGSERAAGLQGGEQRVVAVVGVSQGRGERELRWRGGDGEDGWEVEWEGEEEELVPEVDDPDLLNLVSVCVCVCVCVCVKGRAKQEVCVPSMRI
jgi:hypothetical protein